MFGHSRALRTDAGLWTIPIPPPDSALRVGIAAAMLFAGAMLYGWVRPEGWHGALIGAAPTFIHVVSMSLLCAAALRPARRAAFAWCGFWVAINMLFELGQHAALAPPLAAMLKAQCGALSACDTTAQYFLRGTFDRLDLIAAGLGGVAAWTAFRATSRGRAS